MVGHVFCGSCLAKLRASSGSCSICRGPLLKVPIRSRLLEEHVFDTYVNCPNKADGCCCRIPRARVAEHAGMCAYRQVICGFVSRSGFFNVKACGQVILQNQAAAHWREAHGREPDNVREIDR